MQTLLNSIGERALASTIAGLINEGEALLLAEANGPTVVVRERGEGRMFRLTVEVCEPTG